MGYGCPCCGYFTFPVPGEEAVAFICPVCFWENDVFTSDDGEASDENHGLSLKEGRANFKRFGACAQELLIHVRKPNEDELTGTRESRGTKESGLGGSAGAAGKDESAAGR